MTTCFYSFIQQKRLKAQSLVPQRWHSSPIPAPLELGIARMQKGTRMPEGTNQHQQSGQC